MPVRMRQECGLNKLTLMKKKMEENKPSSMFTSDRNKYSCSCQLEVPSLKTQFFYHILEYTIPTNILSSSPRASNLLPFSFYSTDMGWIISLRVLGQILENEFQVRNLPKTTDCKDDNQPQLPSSAVTQSSQTLAILQHFPKALISNAF